MSVKTCPGCGQLLATWHEAKTTVKFEDHEAGVEIAEIEVDITSRATLAPGFVNRTRRHPSSSLPWYGKPAGRRSYQSPTVRLPVVVTCGCGKETTILGVEEFWVTAAKDERSERARRESADAERRENADRLKENADRLKEHLAERAAVIRSEHVESD